MRTRYGKLSALRTGQESKDFTSREQWILDNFYFLEQHVNRLKKKRRVSSKVLINNKQICQHFKKLKQFQYLLL